MRTTQAVIGLSALLAVLSACSPADDGLGPAAGAAHVVLDPPAVDASPGERIQFAATVVGDDVHAVAWSVEEPDGGTVDEHGAYTAPARAGTFHVVATSVKDETKWGRARVTVGGGETPLPTTPPSDGITRWAPAPNDPEWVKVTDHGAVGDATSDDTAAFRSAAATGKKLFVPKPPVAYRLTGVVRIQNSVYGDGSMPEIRMYGADGDPDQRQSRNIFFISWYTGPGLVIQGVHLNGQWNGGGNGEWSHCINIGNSNNVTVQHNRIEAAYGDDIFIGEFSGPMSDNIVIQNNWLGTARRCNVAMNGATNVVIRNNTIVKTGSTYVSAIDLEPDELGFQYVRGVVIDSNVFDVIQQEWNTGAINMNNPAGNPPSGDVSITNNRGRWSPTAAYMDVVPGSNGLVGIVPHQPWYDVRASNNVRE